LFIAALTNAAVFAAAADKKTRLPATFFLAGSHEGIYNPEKPSIASPMDEQEFDAVLKRVREGDEAAARELVRAYQDQILAHIRNWLKNDGALRRVIDSVDVWQSILGDFFPEVRQGRYQLEKPNDLARLLTTMARHNYLNKVEAAARLKRGGRGKPVEWQDQTDAVIDDAPSPSQQLGNQELLDKILGYLTPLERYLAEQRREDRTWEAIAGDVGMKPDALRKKLGRAVEQALERLGE
jgi:DNA-directed RNA polymerase specialized sigma24 family protein